MIEFFIFILGLAVGSFLNVLIDRLPNDENILGRSHCDYCRKTLQPQDLIPVVSYILLQGRCGECKKPLHIQYPLIELMTGAIFVLSWTGFQHRGMGEQIYTIVLMSIFIAMFFSDLKYHILPDEEQLALFTASSVFFLVNGSSLIWFVERFTLSFVAMMPLLLLFILTKGKGMGFGDVKLSFIFGYIFGLQGAYVILYLAFVAGGLFGLIALLLHRRALKSRVAFGPFLIAAAASYHFFNVSIMTQLHTIFGL